MMQRVRAVEQAAMNRYHRRLCRSAGWSAYLAGTVLPHALAGVALGPRLVRWAACVPRVEGERSHDAA